MHPRLVRSLLLATAALWLPRGAQALSELYLIDPTQSFVTIAAGSGATLDFGDGPIDLPFRTQVGEVAGVSGNVLPGIGLSNGLTTSLFGQIQVDYRPNFNIRFFNGSTFVLLADSGTWAPGDSAVPTAAQGGVAFGGPLGIVGAAALRDAVFNFNTGQQPLTNLGGGVFGYDGIASVSVIDGALDYDTNLFGLEGRGFLDEATVFVGFQPGRVQDLGGGISQITLPLDITFQIGGSTLGLPLSLHFALEGQIVAINRIVPEPASVLLLGSGLVAIAAATQRRRARREGVEHA